MNLQFLWSVGTKETWKLIFHFHFNLLIGFTCIFYAKKCKKRKQRWGVLFYHLHFILLYFTPSFIKFETLYILHCLSVSLVQMSRGTRARVSKLWSPWVAGGRGRLGFTGWYVMPCRNGKVSRISRIQFYLWEWFVFWLKKNWKKETNQ